MPAGAGEAVRGGPACVGCVSGVDGFEADAFEVDGFEVDGFVGFGADRRLSGLGLTRVIVAPGLRSEASGVTAVGSPPRNG